jgi:hypothetical protein
MRCKQTNTSVLRRLSARNSLAEIGATPPTWDTPPPRERGTVRAAHGAAARAR